MRYCCGFIGSVLLGDDEMSAEFSLGVIIVSVHVC